MTKITYQPEIDGLRTLAILSVVFYHVGFEQFSGGFVGVDVFFVISGYLITRIILVEFRESASFLFGRFFMRRVRRLFPAMFCTILFSWIGAFLLFSPEQMKDFGASVSATVFSVSNFYFWSQADYFDALATTKPLLHTWALGVEEQFYLIWPVVLVLILMRLRQKKLILVLISACLGSLALTHYWLGVDRAAAFYLLPSRIMELGIGAIMVWVHPPRVSWKLDLIALVGIGLILFAAMAYTEETPFPGLYALVPCAGTAAFIFAANSRYILRIFRLKPVVWLGRISYSLYLVHWPIIVFFVAYHYQMPGISGQLSIIALSLLLAWLQYVFVEKRFRYAQTNSWSGLKFVLTTISVALLIAVPSLATFYYGGLTWRIPAKRLTPPKQVWGSLETKRYCQNYSESYDPKLFSCQNYRNKKQDIFIWGDSHAKHLVSSFSEVYPDYNIFVLYESGCTPQSGFNGYVGKQKTSWSEEKCVKRNKAALQYFLNSKPTNIVITSAKRSKPEIIAGATEKIVGKLQQAGHKVVVLGDFIRPGVPLNDCIAAPSLIINDERLGERCIGDIKTMTKELHYNEELARFLPNIILPNEIQCPDGQCNFFSKGYLLYRDEHHLNLVGSLYFVERLKPLLPF